MPELPEVETVRRGLALKMTGRHIVTAELRRQDLRRPFPPMLERRSASSSGAASTS
jgi:formamidopyrimidine-DNA glycosylase